MSVIEATEEHFEVYCIQDFRCPQIGKGFFATYEKRWGIRDRSGTPNFGADTEYFATEEEAKARAELWERISGDIITTEFHSPISDYGGDRGTRTVRIKGSTFKWHGGANEESYRVVGRLRDLIAKHGAETVIEVLNAVSQY